MQKASGIGRLQDASDVNVSLGAGVDGYTLNYDHDTAKFVLVEPVSPGSTALADCTDVNFSLGAGVDEYALCYDHDTAKFVLRAVAVGTFLKSDGSVTGASSQAQAFTNGVKAGLLFPAADSTTAIKLTKANGSTAVVTIDTTNSLVGIGCTPSYTLELAGNATGKPDIVLDSQDNSYGYIHSKTDYQRLLFAGGSGASSSYGGYFQVLGNKWAGTAGFRGRVVFTCGTPSSPTGQEGSYTVYSGGSERFCIYSDGKIAIGGVTPLTLIDAGISDAVTNAVTTLLTIRHASSGTPAAGFGAGLRLGLQSSTTADQSAGLIEALWYEATHASRKADLVLSAYDTAVREGLRIRGNGSAAAIGFLGATPAARIAHVADAVTAHAITDPADSPADADALREDLVTNVIPSIETQLNNLGTKINSILTTLESFGFHAES